MIELESKDTYRVAVVGATGAVGREMVAVLEQRAFPVESLNLFASERSEGEEIEYRGAAVRVRALRPDSFATARCDLALFSAGGAVSREYAPQATAAGTVVVDNSSAWRLDPEVPLVVPEVNPHHLAGYRRKGIVANPNCSTIQLVVVLKPIQDAAGLKRVVLSTYQSVSGAGNAGIQELSQQVLALFNQREVVRAKFPHPIAFNLIPQVGSFDERGWCEEERKLIYETRRMLELPDLPVSPTTVRVPVFACHGESVNVETLEPMSPEEVRTVLSDSPGIQVVDDPARSVYPLNFSLAGTDDVYVGRIRADIGYDNAFNCWIVADNLRKGAALNAVQIAETLVKEYA